MSVALQVIQTFIYILKHRNADVISKQLKLFSVTAQIEKFYKRHEWNHPGESKLSEAQSHDSEWEALLSMQVKSGKRTTICLHRGHITPRKDTDISRSSDFQNKSTTGKHTVCYPKSLDGKQMAVINSEC